MPEPLAKEVNSVKLQMVGYVAPDESYLLFSAFNIAGSLGGSDLYISFRRPDGSWGTSVNLGPAVNTPDNEFTPYVSPDGKYLFFSRFNQRPMPGESAGSLLSYREISKFFIGPQNGLRDIFWIEAAVFQRIRAQSK
jgi:WD40-like Beta Propeller Repeat